MYIWWFSVSLWASSQLIASFAVQHVFSFIRVHFSIIDLNPWANPILFKKPFPTPLSCRKWSFSSLGFRFYTGVFDLFGDNFLECGRDKLTVIFLSMKTQSSCPILTETADFPLVCILGVYVISIHWALPYLENYLLPLVFYSFLNKHKFISVP